MVFSDYRIWTPPKHRFFMVLMQFWFCNPASTSTNSENVCNMDSHFKDNINLPNFFILVFLWFYLTWIELFLFFLKAKFKIGEMGEIMIADYT